MRRSGSDTREEIVDQALQLFTLKGYHHTSIRDLLIATGLTKGGLYGHFGSKEEIWEAAYERAVEIWRGIVFRGVSDIADPLERIHRVIEQDLGDYVGGRAFEGGCFFFNLLVELSGQSPDMAAQILHGFDSFSALLAGWLQEAQGLELLHADANPREIADFLVMALNGATALYSARQDPEVLQQAIRQLVRHLEAWRK